VANQRSRKRISVVFQQVNDQAVSTSSREHAATEPAWMDADDGGRRPGVTYRSVKGGGNVSRAPGLIPSSDRSTGEVSMRSMIRCSCHGKSHSCIVRATTQEGILRVCFRA